MFLFISYHIKLWMPTGEIIGVDKYKLISEKLESPVELKPDHFTGKLSEGPVVMTAVVVDEQGK